MSKTRRAEPLVLVIVRTKDRAVFLARALASLAAQTRRQWTCVVVNDGGPAGVVDTVVQELPEGVRERVAVVHHAHSLGMEAAANAGATTNASRYIALLDDDDTWEPTFLEETLEFLEKDAFGATCVAVASQSAVIRESVDDNVISFISRTVMNPGLRNLTLARVAARNQITNNALLFRRSAFDAIGGFDASLPVLGDWDFLYKLLMNGDIGVIPLPLANYHQRDAAAGGSDANSFAGRVNLHDHYDAHMQNKYMRSAMAGKDVARALAMGLGRELDDMRRELERLSVRVASVETRFAKLTKPLNGTVKGLAKAWSRVANPRGRNRGPKG